MQAWALEWNAKIYSLQLRCKCPVVRDYPVVLLNLCLFALLWQMRKSVFFFIRSPFTSSEWSLRQGKLDFYFTNNLFEIKTFHCNQNQKSRNHFEFTIKMLRILNVQILLSHFRRSFFCLEKIVITQKWFTWIIMNTNGGKI